ncbi:MAG TPA: hypothetical protein VIT41_17260 [Microlunatus sp.]
MTTTVGGASAGPATAPAHLGRRLALLGAVLVVTTGLPFIFLREDGPRWYHLVFHLIGITVCAIALVVLREVRRAAASTTLRVMTWVSTVAVTGWLIGHLGELVTVLTHGGAHADEDLFQHPVHTFFATIAVPSWMATVLSVLVLLITAGIQAISRRVRR